MAHPYRMIFFRVLGALVILAAAPTFYVFGSELIPLFKANVQGQHDVFLIFLVLTTFFLGVPALLVVGSRLLFLRSFSTAWLYVLTMPITASIYVASGITRIYDMDTLLSSEVLYILVYGTMLYLFRVIHREFYTPVSHEKFLYVGLEKQNKPKSPLGALLVIVALIGVLFVHPTPFPETLRMLFSPAVHFYAYVTSML